MSKMLNANLTPHSKMYIVSNKCYKFARLRHTFSWLENPIFFIISTLYCCSCKFLYLFFYFYAWANFDSVYIVSRANVIHYILRHKTKCLKVIDFHPLSPLWNCIHFASAIILKAFCILTQFILIFHLYALELFYMAMISNSI